MNATDDLPPQLLKGRHVLPLAECDPDPRAYPKSCAMLADGSLVFVAWPSHRLCVASPEGQVRLLPLAAPLKDGLRDALVLALGSGFVVLVDMHTLWHFASADAAPSQHRIANVGVLPDHTALRHSPNWGDDTLLPVCLETGVTKLGHATHAGLLQCDAAAGQFSWAQLLQIDRSQLPSHRAPNTQPKLGALAVAGPRLLAWVAGDTGASDLKWGMAYHCLLALPLSGAQAELAACQVISDSGKLKVPGQPKSGREAAFGPDPSLLTRPMFKGDAPPQCIAPLTGEARELKLPRGMGQYRLLSMSPQLAWALLPGEATLAVFDVG